MKKKSFISSLIPSRDVASGAHTPAPTAFSVSNDSLDHLKRKKRKKKIKKLYKSALIRMATGLTSIQNSSIMEDESDDFDQGVVLGLGKDMVTSLNPDDQEEFSEEFIDQFGFFGPDDFDLPPANKK